MAWDWLYEADGVDLFDHCKAVRVVTEYGLASKGSVDFVNPGQHGSYYVSGKLLGPGNVELVTYVLDSEPDGSITHVDGSAGHIMENISVLKRIFGKTTGLVTLRRTAPHIGGMEILVESIDQPRQGSDRFEIIWSLNSPKPLWRSETVTNTASLATGNFNPGGDAPVDDAVLTFGGAGSVVNALTGTGFEVTAACVVNCGTGAVTVGGSPTPGLILPQSERWLHFEGGVANALTVSGTVSMNHYPKWG